MTDHLWQKAYGEPGHYRPLYDNNVIFCPYMHSWDTDHYRQYEDDIHSLRQYSINNGYKAASTSTIQKYLSIFMDYDEGKNIYIPRRSFNANEPSDKGVHVRVRSIPYHGNINNFYGLFCDVEGSRSQPEGSLRGPGDP